MVQSKPNPGGNSDDAKHLRLTLRTLLAYLDDVLEPAQAREIGTKIQETQYASQLVDRIQDVLRRRRVEAPDLTGPGSGLDPNTVAEYLDNTLPPQSVPDVERVCLESDMHLAEVAACHQILTLVLGDPIHVSAESRERLHALIPAALAHKSRPESALAPAARAGAIASPSRSAREAVAPAADRPADAVAHASHSKTAAHPSSNGGESSAKPVAATRFSETIPDYLKPKPFWKRALVPAFVVLVLMLWVGLLIYDPTLLGTGSNTSDEISQNDLAQATKPETQTQAEQTPAVAEHKPESDANASNVPASTVTPEETPKQPIEIDAKPPEDKKTDVEVAVAPMPNTNSTETTPAKGTETNATVVPEKTSPLPAESTEPKTTPTVEPVTPMAASVNVVYSTRPANNITKGMLLRYDASSQEWGTLPYRSRVMAGEQLACPEPLDAVFTLSKSDCEVTFIGGVLASFEPAQPSEGFSLNLKQGKVVFTRPESNDEAPAQNAAFSVVIGADVLRWELDPNTRCGLEILPKLPNQLEQGLGPNWYAGRLWVETGMVRLLDRTKTPFVIAAKQALDLTPNQVPADQPQPASQVVESDQLMPEWLNPQSRTFTSKASQFMRQIYDAFAESDVESDVTQVLLPLAKNPNTLPPVAVMAAKTLAMTGCVRDVADLLSLNEASPEELRLATIDATRRWLTLHPDKKHGQVLKKELERNFLPDTAAKVYRLLWGYRQSDVMDNSQAIQLVDYLMDDNITVRTLAFLHLEEMTGKHHNYRPLDSESQRKTAASRWREDVLSGNLF